MDLTLTAEQRELQKTLRAFAREELNDNTSHREQNDEFSWTSWRKCAAFGLQALPLPEEYGGRGANALTCILAMEALGYGCRDNGFLFTLNSHLWSCEIPILLMGSTVQRSKYLPLLARGEIIGGHAISEADAGSDVYALGTTAVRHGDRYILNGRKVFVSNAPIADLLLVFATTEPQKGWAGISGFIVERGTPGLAIESPLRKMGLRTAPIADVVLHNCELPLDSRLGAEGAGSSTFNCEMEWERICLFATHLGAMERQLEDCVSFARRRKQRGQPIGRFQAISHKIADMKMRVELGRLILHKAGWLKSRGQSALLDSMIAKLWVSESYVANSLDAVQIHGGNGYLTEFEVERELRDSIGSKIYSGTSEIHRNAIAAMLGL